MTFELTLGGNNMIVCVFFFLKGFNRQVFLDMYIRELVNMFPQLVLSHHLYMLVKEFIKLIKESRRSIFLPMLDKQADSSMCNTELVEAHMNHIVPLFIAGNSKNTAVGSLRATHIFFFFLFEASQMSFFVLKRSFQQCTFTSGQTHPATWNSALRK